LSKDINPILNGWDHDPDEFQVRIVAGADGRDKLQRRLDLGLIQMEMVGRPDGERPHGFDSLLEYHEARAKDSKDPDAYQLDSEACSDLMREGLQYYHRYLAAYHLRRFDMVARDTTRNLRLFAFAVKHAPDRRDQVQFDQYRPYVTMMRARALSSEAMERNDHVAALKAVDEGIEGIRVFLRDYEQEEDQFQCRELSKLLKVRREIESSRPVGPVERMEQQLELAVSLEDYEEAARLRDQLARLRGLPASIDSKAGRSC
jgi:UvrB/uvrC motif